jgi:hypothetical protein
MPDQVELEVREVRPELPHPKGKGNQAASIAGAGDQVVSRSNRDLLRRARQSLWAPEISAPAGGTPFPVV